MCSQNCEKKLLKLASRFLMSSQHCEKRPKLASLFLMSSQHCKRNSQNLHNGFWYVHNILKKKKAEICITGFDLFTTLWKKGNLRHCFWCVRCEKRPKILWWFLICWEHCEEKAESCITVFNVFSQF